MATIQGHHTPPTARSSFVGRKGELNALGTLLESAPLVTIQGPGGMGKTRLALTYAEALDEGAWPGGVFLIDLSLSTNLAQMRLGVASALGLALSGRDDDAAAERIDHALASRPPLLMLLDNVEHLVDHTPETVGRWLDASSRLKILATSRERLNLAGEVVLELSPLAVPQTPECADNAEAVQLFMTRAQAARPGFQASDPAAIGRLVSMLDGIPLAIELAAAQIGIMSPEQLIARMDHKLDLLVAGRRDATLRHKTLRHAIDGSWASLDERSQRAMMQCAVFRGGFDLEAIEALTETPTAAASLRRLRDASLLRSLAPEPDAPLRFGFYASIRDYALEKLDASGLWPDTAQKHAALYGDPRFVLGNASPSSPEGIARLAQEESNLSAALDWALAHDPDDIESPLQTARMLGRLYQVRGPLNLLSATLDKAFEITRRAEPRPEVLCDLLSLRGRVQIFLGDRDAAQQNLDAALTLARDIKRPDLEAAVLGHKATLARQADATQDAEAGYRDALARLEGTGEARRIEGEVLSNLAGLLFEQARLEEALEVFNKALDALRDAKSHLAEAVVVGNMGILHQEAGRAEIAREHLSEALAMHRKVGHLRFEGITLGDMAALATEEHKPLEAVECYARAVDLLGQSGDKRHQLLMRAGLSACQARLGRLEQARQTARGAEQDLDRLGVPTFAAAARVYALSATLAAVIDDDTALETALEDASEAIDTASKGRLGEISDEVRLALRLTGQHLDSVRDRTRAIRISADLDRFQMPGATWVSLGQKPVLKHLFAALVDARLRDPSQHMPLATLIERGWPGERIMAEAATNRIHVSLSQLRKLGLKPLLLRRGDGYMLDPSVPVLMVVRGWTG